MFDRLTELAARELGVPTAVMSLVDDRRQFFKSMRGLEGEAAEQRGTPLSHSFCQHVVHTGTPLCVEDARRHPLVRDNLAVRDVEVIAYLGVPLVTSDGAVVGSLCAIDAEPHTWTDADAERLGALAGEVMRELALRETERLRTYSGPRPQGEDFDPGAIVDAACEHVAADALHKGLQVTTWIDDAVPATLHGDAERLRQTLDHLLANAIAFTPAGRVDVRVRSQTGGVLRTEIADTGIGIAAEDLERVFEPFSASARARATARRSISRRASGPDRGQAPSAPGSVAGLVLERDREAHAEVDHATVLDRDVLADDLGHAQVAYRLGRGLDRDPRRGLPRLAAHADDLGHAVHAVSHWGSPPGRFREVFHAP